MQSIINTSLRVGTPDTASPTDGPCQGHWQRGPAKAIRIVLDAWKPPWLALRGQRVGTATPIAHEIRLVDCK